MLIFGDRFFYSNDLASVVQSVDNFIQWIRRHPADKMYLLEYILSAG